MGTSTTWTNPNERPSDRVEPERRRVILTDLTMSLDLFPLAGYNWYNHRNGGGNQPNDTPGTPEWAALLYSDGSVDSTRSDKWIVRVQTSNGIQWKW